MAGPSDEQKELSFASQVEKFDFCGEAIDTALRKLLAKVILPKEAQQIDRAMEDFAKRYYECNSTLVDNPDVVYAVAFSLVLLHTDAHNKNVRQKMNKDTFIMRTKIIEGGEAVPHEILDVMYDNIVVSEFTYADKQRDTLARQERSNSWFSKLKNGDNTSVNIQSVALLNDLGQKLEQLMPAENTFSYKRSLKPIPIMEIHFSLLKAKSLCLSGVRSRHGYDSSSNTFTIRVTKAGIMDRKYDLVQGGKKATARSWRPFGVILSGSQIIFFADISAFQTYLDREKRAGSASSSDLLTKRNNSFPAFSSLTSMDPTSTSHISVHSTMSSLSDNSSQLITPIPTTSSSTNTISFQSYLRPMQIVSLSYAICIYDESYTKYPFTFRLITGDGQQFLLRADNEKDMDDWMMKINYAATLKTTGVRMRPKDQKERPKQAKEKIEELTNRIDEQVRILDRELQLRRNLMVLQPFQKATKDRIISFADTLGKRIRTKRIELQRLECYRDYLECELNWYSSQKYQSRKLSLPLPSYHYSLIPPAITGTTNSTSTLPILKKETSMTKLSSAVFEAPSENPTPNASATPPSVVLGKQETPQLLPLSEKPVKVISNKTLELDRINRRRSQSNPIIPNAIIDKKLLLSPNQIGRQRSGSEASSVQGDDDDMSVVIVNDSEELLTDNV